eukprot:2773965-Amphidinium_carterae.1
MAEHTHHTQTNLCRLTWGWHERRLGGDAQMVDPCCVSAYGRSPSESVHSKVPHHCPRACHARHAAPVSC